MLASMFEIVDQLQVPMLDQLHWQLYALHDMSQQSVELGTIFFNAYL